MDEQMQNQYRKSDLRIPWDKFFMLQAALLSTRGTCNRLSVGAVLVKNNRIIASGYNGSVSGDAHCIDEGCYMVNGHCLRTIHAEMNAIVQCAKFGESADGAEIYVTDFPCLQCTKMLLQAGITKINYLRNYHNNQYAQHLIKLKKVDLKQVKIDQSVIDKIPFETYLSK